MIFVTICSIVETFEIL